jgi:hypothetical protein
LQGSPGPGQKTRISGRGWLVLCLVLALLPLVPIAIGAIPLASEPAGSALRPLPADLTPRTTTTRTPPHRVRHAVTATGAKIALVTRATELRTAPNGAVISAQPTTTQFGSPVAYFVRRVDHGWLGVVSPLAGNGRLGWIPASDAKLDTVNWALDVSLAHRRLTVTHAGKVVQSYPIAIGRPSAPTPTGVFAVTDRLSTGDPAGPYGCCILALSALAPHAIQDWSGGDRIAIHSTPPDTYWSIGDPITHGCMHVTLPQGQWLLDHIPLGTPAIIRSD